MALVSPGNCLADIGTDHGYVPIELVKRRCVKSAIAMDVRTGPLMRAKENIRRAMLTEQIETRLSDGAAALRPGEADRAVIAGMGGYLVLKILEEGSASFCEMEEFVLQPQSDIDRVRLWLSENGYCIKDEDFVEEDGKYYPMMSVIRGQMPPMSAEEILYGPLLLKKRHPVLKRYLEKEENTFDQIRRNLKGCDSERAQKRIRELAEKEDLLQKAIAVYREKGEL